MPRILHVISNLDLGGGSEAWCMNMLRRLDGKRFPVTFCCLLGQEGALEAEARELGAEIVHIDRRPSLRTFKKRMSSFLQAERFDVVHVHLLFFSGVVAKLADAAGVPIRVVHSRNAGTPDRRSLWRMAYRANMRRLIARHATSFLAVSNMAADFLYGADSRVRQSVHVLSSGIDAERFRVTASREELLRDMGVPASSIVFGHVGQFRRQKNHAFLMKVAAAVLGRQPDAFFVCVGDGEERSGVERLAESLGISDRVAFAGVRADVPAIMKYALDCMVFPSHYEGLPQAVIEAQCAGLPSVISDSITPEVTVIPELVQRVPLSAGATRWVEVALREAIAPRYDKDKAWEVIRSSRFEFHHHLDVIEKIYTGQMR